VPSSPHASLCRHSPSASVQKHTRAPRIKHPSQVHWFAALPALASANAPPATPARRCPPPPACVGPWAAPRACSPSCPRARRLQQRHEVRLRQLYALVPEHQPVLVALHPEPQRQPLLLLRQQRPLRVALARQLCQRFRGCTHHFRARATRIYCATWAQAEAVLLSRRASMGAVSSQENKKHLLERATVSRVQEHRGQSAVLVGNGLHVFELRALGRRLSTVLGPVQQPQKTLSELGELWWFVVGVGQRPKASHLCHRFLRKCAAACTRGQGAAASRPACQALSCAL
jgi:hypothetical protein